MCFLLKEKVKLNLWLLIYFFLLVGKWLNMIVCSQKEKDMLYKYEIFYEILVKLPSRDDNTMPNYEPIRLRLCGGPHHILQNSIT